MLRFRSLSFIVANRGLTWLIQVGFTALRWLKLISPGISSLSQVDLPHPSLLTYS